MEAAGPALFRDDRNVDRPDSNCRPSARYEPSYLIAVSDYSTATLWGTRANSPSGLMQRMYSPCVRSTMSIPSLTRENVLAFRQRATYLHRRLPPGRLADAAFAGLQDSNPR